MSSIALPRNVRMRTVALWGSGALWIALVLLGYGWMADYATTPGVLATVPSIWKDDLGLGPLPEDGAIVVFLHPCCPCSNASLTELEEVVSRTKTPPIRMVFFVPNPITENWTQSTAVSLARALPGASVVWDERGVIADRFGAKTSGHVLWYDRSGTLQFSGGVTAMRGHIGPNRGQAALVDLCRGKRPTAATTPVFGCSLEQTRRVAFEEPGGQP